MAELPVFQTKQFEFSAYIRDPRQFPAPADVEPRRMAIYRELFFNNVEGFLATTFPVLKSLMPEQQWLDLVQDYFCNNRSQSPYFTSIPEQFIEFLNAEGVSNANQPFIQELAHYEWIEMVLMLAEGEAPALTGIVDKTTLLSSVVNVSQLAYPLIYQYPVHQISPDYQPDACPETPSWLVVYRNTQDDVKFMAINAVTYALLDNIDNHPELTCREHLQQISDQLNHPQPEQVLEFGVSIIQGLLERNIIGITVQSA